MRRTPSTTIRGLQQEMDEFVESRGWYASESDKPQDPRNLAVSISLEANEVLECFQWSNDVNLDEVGAELADVVLYAAQLANVLQLDLGLALDRKLELNRSRFEAVGSASCDRRQAS